METLVKLRLVQAKGSLRNLFAKPLSAIVTVVLVGVYALMLVPIILHANEPPISGQAAYGMILSILGFGMLLQLSTLLQNKKSLFFLSDAHYMYTGPFSRKQILGAYALDNMTSALFFGLLSLIPIVMGSMSGSVPVAFIITAFLAGTLAHYGLLMLIGILYVRQLAGRQKGNGSMAIVAGFALVLVAVGVAVFAGVGFDIPKGLSAIMVSPLLNWVPFFGWARMAMVGVLEGGPLLVALGAGLLLLADALLTAALVNSKGDFYEQSMLDAETFTEYYQKAKSGQATGDEKVHKASVRFGKGEKAIFSKNLLIALKGRELLRLQDFLVIAIYLGMAYFMEMGFVTFSAMLMFWMFMMAGTSSLVDDLKHHYVYLIPGGALKKLLYTLAVPLAKNAIVLAISLVGGGLLLKTNVQGMVTALLICLSILLVFMAGNVLSIRLMKSRTNKMVEQTLRLLLAALALVPGLVVYVLLQFIAGGWAAALAGPVFAGFNLLFSFGVLLACCPMMQGNELNAD